MNSVEQLGQLLVNGISFLKDPRDDSKFIFPESAQFDFYDNILKINKQSLEDYKELRKSDMEPIECVRKILDTSRKAFVWAYGFWDQNYPGAVVDKDRLNDYLMVFITETIYGGLISEDNEEFDYQAAKDFVEVIINSDDTEIQETLVNHRICCEHMRNSPPPRTQSNIPEFIGRTLHEATICNTTEELSGIEKGVNVMLNMQFSQGMNAETVDAMQALVPLIHFIHYFIVNNKIPTEDDVFAFFDDPQQFLTDFSD